MIFQLACLRALNKFLGEFLFLALSPSLLTSQDVASVVFNYFPVLIYLWNSFFLQNHFHIDVKADGLFITDNDWCHVEQFCPH